MQCKEFREISDSYLSDELLVETNHQIYRHMEHCSKCREDFAARRKFREKMRSVVMNADEFQMSPVFLNRLTANLESDALSKNSWRNLFSSPRLLVPVMASLLIAMVVMGIGYFNYNPDDQVATKYKSMIQGLTEISLKAVGDHKDCALEKLPRWEAVSGTDYPEKAVFTEKVLMPLKAKFSENVEMLNAHDCIFEGTLFTHVILKDGSRIVSVFIDKSRKIPLGEAATETITSDSNQGLQVASFHKSTQAVFVVSDLPEAENIRIARTLSGVFSV